MLPTFPALQKRAEPTPTAIIAWRVAHAVFHTAGRPTLIRASALGAAIGIVATIVFAGNGMRAMDLVHLFHASWRVRATLWIGWTALATPAFASAFDAPGTRMLRTMRVPQAPLLASLLALFACVELPWGLLFARGDNCLQGVTVSAVAIALQSGIVAARARSRAAWLTLPGLALAVWDLRGLIAAAPAIAAAVACVRAAWLQAPEKHHRAVRVMRAMPVVLALTVTHILRLARSERARLSLGALGTAAGSAFLSLSLLNAPPARPLQRGVLVMTLPLTLAAAVLSSPLLDAERRLRPWLHSLRIRSSAVVLAFVLALATPSFAFAASGGTIAGAVGGVSPFALGSELAIASLASTTCIATWARLHNRTRKPNPIAFVIGSVAVAFTIVGLAAAW